MPDPIAFFAIRLIFGIAVSILGLVQDSAEKASGLVVSAYFRIQMLLILGLSVLYGLMAPDQKWGALFLGSTAFVGSALWALERRRAGSNAIGLIALGSAVSGYLLIRSGSDGGPLLWASTLSSSLTLGVTLSAMLLGHRYLTAPGMALGPLQDINRWVGRVALVRCAVSAVSLILYSGALTQQAYFIWLSLRWLAGIFGPIVVSYMVRRILVHRNTQSATGVLFVGVILTFIGELTADVLYRTIAVPF